MQILKDIILKLEYINAIEVSSDCIKKCSLYDIALLKTEERWYLSWHQVGTTNYIHFYLSRQSNLGLEYINNELTDDQFNYIRKYYYFYINK